LYGHLHQDDEVVPQKHMKSKENELNKDAVDYVPRQIAEEDWDKIVAIGIP